jgi:hypothetical protein
MSTPKKQTAGTVTVAGHRLSTTGALGLLLWLVALSPDSLMRKVETNRCRCGPRHEEHFSAQSRTNIIAQLP